MGIAAAVAAGVIVYIGLVLFMARAASDKWHPDGGRKGAGR